MQKLSNQQSIVRTDFTLKYYQVDELLDAHQKLKICGAQSLVFMRSWLDYSLIRGDTIVPWLSGDYSAFLKVFSHVFKESVEDSKALATCLNNANLSRKTIITVNLSVVSATELTKLLNAIIPKKLQQAAQLPEQQGNAVTSISAIKLANIVIWTPDGEWGKKDYQSVLAGFSAALDVGGVKEQPVKVVGRKLPIGLAALVAITVVGVYLQYDSSHSNEAIVTTLKPASMNNDQTEVKPTSVDVKAISRSIKVDVIAQENQSAAEITEVVGSLQRADRNAAVITFIEPKKLTLVTKDTPATTEKAVLTGRVKSLDKESVNEKIVTSISKTITPDSTRNSTVDSDTGNSDVSVGGETVDIVQASSAQVINVGSSIKTSSPSSVDDVVIETNKHLTQNQKIDLVVAAWAAAWQQQKFDDYSRHYINTFTANKRLSHNQWLDWRRKRIEKPAWIKLSFSNIKHLKNEQPGVHSITFTLVYSSPNYKDKTFKRLSFKWVDKELKIISEDNLQVTKI